MSPLRFFELLLLALLWHVVPVEGLASGPHNLGSKGATSPSQTRSAAGRPFTGGAYSYGEACILGGKNYFLTGAGGPKPFAGRGWTEKVAQQQPSSSTASSDGVSNASSDPSSIDMKQELGKSFRA